MTLIADVYPKLRTQKNLVRSMSKKSRFKGSFGKQHGKRTQTLLKFTWQHIYHIYWSLCRILSYKKSLLVICKSQVCFLTHWVSMASILFLIETNQRNQFRCKYPRKVKTFSEFSSAFFKSSFNFEHFQRKGCLS